MNTLKIQNISLGYKQNGSLKIILHDFNLNIRAGELVCLLGASGVGKSSLLRMLAGLNQPLSGSVSLFGEKLTKPHPRVGLVFQSAALLPWLNVRDNVAFGLDFAHQPKISKDEQSQRIDAALKEVGLANAANKYPSELSGGMAQRVALARGIVRQPQVLLLDEPFSALDAVIREQMQAMLRQIVQHHNTAALMVTHDIDEALLVADKIVLVGGGGHVAGTWQPELPFPRTVRLVELQNMRSEIVQSLYTAQQHTEQTKTVEFVI
ncbi:MAG: ABC transporter ATP-binding protein [Alysiella sp.]|uniref:ABC transporter ATP-binding protein n=1 Tax=Alysiella sp. TaxID=1872483 RepID=UPI0026DDB218|nr:ABC transporter ATP-binding protein [Alysiella sp.]MDO4434715.1 ABC transporter ATP-binding protein [Alysiella sp.]